SLFARNPLAREGANGSVDVYTPRSPATASKQSQDSEPPIILRTPQEARAFAVPARNTSLRRPPRPTTWNPARASGPAPVVAFGARLACDSGTCGGSRRPRSGERPDGRRTAIIAGALRVSDALAHRRGHGRKVAGEGRREAVGSGGSDRPGR